MSDTNKVRTGLVLEGGAMRGMYTCGVLDVFMEEGITFDGAAGVSAGAVFGCNIKSGQVGRAIRYNKKYCGDPRYASIQSLIKTGSLFGTDFCYRVLPRELDVWDEEAYRANPMEFYVVTTDIETGRACYHLCKEGGDTDIEWMRASASMPLVSKIVEIGDRKLLDGGVADSIPIRFMEHKGYNHNVVVLTQPLDYVKTKNKLLPLIRAVMHKYPRFVHAMENRHVRYNACTAYIREKELGGELFVIRPPQPLNISATESDPNELERVYQIGRKAAYDCLEELKAYLAK